MLSLSRPLPAWPKFAMLELPENTSANRKRMGRALAALRERTGLTQPQAAERANVSTQAWQNYEYGLRRFTPALVDKVTEALDADGEELLLALAGIPGQDAAGDDDRRGFREVARLFELPVAGRVALGESFTHVRSADEARRLNLRDYFSGDWAVLPVVDGAMIPYVSPGGFVTYNPQEWPAPGAGCVVELTTGEMQVRRFEGTDSRQLHLAEIYPALRPVSLQLSAVRGVYAVGLRKG